MFWDRIRRTPSGVAYKYYERPTRLREVSWNEFGLQVQYFSLGLASLGVKEGARVAIIGGTGPEWTIADLGALGIGGVSVGIYPTLPPDQIRYVLEHCEPEVIVCGSRAVAEIVSELKSRLPKLRKVIAWGGGAGVTGMLPFGDLMQKGKELLEADERRSLTLADAARTDDLALIIYTSGTTGPPKGVMLTHANCIFVVRALVDLLPAEDNDETVSFLPMAHVAEHVVGFYTRLATGVTTTYAPNADKVLSTIRDVRPQAFGSVPRVFEKAYARIQSALAAAPPPKQKLWQWATEVGVDIGRRRVRGESIPRALALKGKAADSFVFSNVRRAFGGRVRYLVSGAAPISVEILEFFEAAGMRVIEAYGLTESTGLCTINRLSNVRYGTVGELVPGIEVEVASDGEILTRGPHVFAGYYKDEDATRAALREDGWLHTGDIGEFDAEGFLRVTDRKKNLFVLAGGTRVAPARIEAKLRREPLLGSVLVHGNQRTFLVALITVDPDEARSALRAPGLSEREVIEHPEVRRRIAAAVVAANADIAPHEQIKKYDVIAEPFSVEGGELTATFKVRRKVIEERYARLLDDMYA